MGGATGSRVCSWPASTSSWPSRRTSSPCKCDEVRVIVVCGEALIDEIHSPDGSVREEPGGGPLNTARALARLGAPTAFVGHLSDDEFGRRLAGILEADGVSLELATVGPEPTTRAIARLRAG